MEIPSAAAAARNNALWCDAVCRAHGLSTQIVAELWSCLHPAPRFYPNVVTLDRHATQPQTARIGALLDAGRPGAFSVKDSFTALDLAPLGFAPLFDATWIARPALPFVEAASGLRWATVRTPAQLADWEVAWAAGEDAGAGTVFPSTLLDNPYIFFLAGIRGRTIVAGGILNRTSTREGMVVGISNTFAAVGEDGRACWIEVAAQAARLAPECPAVGYEAGERLAWALDAGFVALQPLRVWARTTS